MNELDIFVEAFAITDSLAREQYLSRVCDGNPQLRQRVETLLQAQPAPENSLRSQSPSLDLLGLTWNIRGPQTTTATVSSGTVVSHRFELLQAVGEGGMGVVYRAFDRNLQRIVAIKMLRSHIATSAEVQERFRNETLAIAKLQHTHIVQLHDVGIHEQTPYFAMEFLSGGTLAQRINHKPLFVPHAAEIVRQLASAIAHAHRQGVIHRDLKPTNIIATATDDLKITDFGAARLFQPEDAVSLLEKGLTRTDMVIGTPQYMAPEQARGTPVTPAVDIHALGMILYEMLTGRVPFDGSDPFEIFSAIIHDEPIPPSRLNRQVPRGLETICLKCLEKQPHQRYATADELAEDVSRFLRGEPIHAKPASWARRAWVAAKRHPALSGSVLGAVLAGLCGIVAVVYQLRATMEQARQAELARGEMAVERDRSQVSLYASRISQAFALLESGNNRRASQLLDECNPSESQPDFRHWEWGYLHGQASRQLWSKPMARTTESISICPRQIRYSPSGRLIAVTGGNPYLDDLHWDRFAPATIGILNANDGQSCRVLRDCLSASAQYIGWLSESELLTIDHHGTVRCFNVDDGRQTREWLAESYRGSADERPRPSVVAPNQDVVIRNEDAHTLAVWDIAQKREVRRIPFSRAVQIRQVLSSTRWLIQDKNGVVLFDPEKNSEVARYLGEFDSCRPAPDGSRILTYQSYDHKGAIACWEMTTGKKLWENTDYQEGTDDFQISPDGKTALQLLRLDTHYARVWDLARGAVLAELRGHGGRIPAAQFSPDGSQVATASEDRTVRLWNARTGEVVARFSGHEQSVRCLVYSPDGTTLTTGGMDAAVYSWDVTSARTNFSVLPPDFDFEVREEGPLFAAMAFRPTGELRILNTASGLSELDPATGNPLAFRKFDGLQSRKEKSHPDFAFDESAMRIVGHTAERELLVVWNAESGQQIFTTSDIGGKVLAVAIDRAGKTIVCSASRKTEAATTFTVSVWDVEGNSCLAKTSSENPIPVVAFDPDERSIALARHMGEQSRIELWNWRTQQTEVFANEIPGQVRQMAFHRLGQLAVCFLSPTGFHLQSWNCSNKQLLWTKDTGAVAGLTFSPDGKRLAAAQMNDKLLLLTSDSGDPLLELTANVNRRGNPAFPARSVFSSDGRHLAMNNSLNQYSAWYASSMRLSETEREQQRLHAITNGRFFHHLRSAEQASRLKNLVSFQFHVEQLKRLSPPTQRLKELTERVLSLGAK